MIQVYSGLRTNICQVPMNSASPNTAKASQKCARMSFLFANTAQPPALFCARSELRLVDHPNLAPHALMPEAAKLLAWHQIIAGLLEAHELLGDVTRHQHGVDVGALDQDAVDDIGGGGPQRDGRLRW